MAFEKIKRILGRKKELPEGLWTKCPDCGSMIFKKEVEERSKVCTECGYHFTLPPVERINLLLDKDSFQPMWDNLESSDPLQFEGITSYKKKLAAAKKKTGARDACVTGTGRIEDRKVMFGMTDSRFIMGSMGSVVGEKIARCFEYAAEKRLPVIFVSGSGGGARMFEGAISLMQMAKTSGAIGRFGERGGVFLSVLTNPTMAGVMASFASLGDVILAEPKALIGFTGPRVIEQTIKTTLPPGFQTSEFLLEHGFLDRVVERSVLRSEISTLLGYLA